MTTLVVFTSQSNPYGDCFVPSPIYELAARVAESRQVTAVDRYLLRTAFLEKSLDEEEHRIVDRIHRALLKGYIKMV